MFEAATRRYPIGFWVLFQGFWDWAVVHMMQPFCVVKGWPDILIDYSMWHVDHNDNENDNFWCQKWSVWDTANFWWFTSFAYIQGKSQLCRHTIFQKIGCKACGCKLTSHKETTIWIAWWRCEASVWENDKRKKSDNGWKTIWLILGFLDSPIYSKIS